MDKVAIVGDKVTALGFKALGLNAYSVSRPEEVREIWSQILADNYAVIFVTEQVYLQIKDLLPAIDQKETPVVLIIPEAAGGTKLGRERIKKTVEKAIGVDILTKEEKKEGEEKG